ncbi:MAG: hypothetical protein K8T91_20620 [Planctomycetes bacterium]|nr:hypothetical protein [Planctomycetota bacterium]
MDAGIAVGQEMRRLPPVTSDEPVIPASVDDASEAPADDDFQRSTEHERAGLGSSERLIDRVTDPTSWLMDFRLRDLAVFPTSDAEDDSNTIDFRLQMPFLLWGEINLLRVDVPYNISSSKGSGLGDIVMFDLVVFDAPWGRWGIGPGMRLISDPGDEDSFLLGPVAGTVWKNEHWTVGILSENYFSGDNSLSELQPILAYKFNEQFALGIGESKFKYDWSTGAWTQIPLGVEAKYIADLHGQKIEFFINPQYSFRNSAGDPEWMLYVGLTLLVPEA